MEAAAHLNSVPAEFFRFVILQQPLFGAVVQLGIAGHDHTKKMRTQSTQQVHNIVVRDYPGIKKILGLDKFSAICRKDAAGE